MRLALQTDYALRALMYLAVRGGRVTTGDIAAFYGVSAAHVAKVVNHLARLGLVRCVRGIGGGVQLAKEPENISIGEVIESFEGNLHLLECVGVEDVCVIQRMCKLKSVLAEAERIQLEYLTGITLADVVPTRAQLSRVAALK